MAMAREKKRRVLERLADELAALSKEERARVLADVASRRRFRTAPPGFKFPVIPNSEGRWVGGSLRREELYGDDGR